MIYESAALKKLKGWNHKGQYTPFFNYVIFFSIQRCSWRKLSENFWKLRGKHMRWSSVLVTGGKTSNLPKLNYDIETYSFPCHVSNIELLFLLSLSLSVVNYFCKKAPFFFAGIVHFMLQSKDAWVDSEYTSAADVFLGILKAAIS